MNPNYSGPKNTIHPSELNKYENGHWVLEPKIDGMWVQFSIRNSGEHVFLSRKNITPEKQYIKNLQIKLPFEEGTIFCAELFAGTDRATNAYNQNGFYGLYLFDCIQLGSTSLREQSFLERRKILETIYREIQFCTLQYPGRFNLVPCCNDLFQSRYQHIIDNGGEGVVLKNINAKYEIGKNDSVVKCKHTCTQDFILIGIQKTPGGDPTGEWGILEDGKLTYRFKAQPADLSLLRPESCGKLVAEFQCFGLQSSGAPRSATFLRVREDLNPEDTQ